MIPLFKVHNPQNLGERVETLFNSGQITEGKFSDEFERQFSKFVGNENTSLVNSCTSALTLAYHVCDLREGDEIITTPMTCMATNEPLMMFGIKMVFADINPNTGNIDPEDVQRKITNKTKAIVAVHWAGQPFDIDSINSIARQHDIRVIEDAAHALGAKYNGMPIGSHSDFVCFSFQAIKHLTTGDGGAICSKFKADDTRIKKLRWFGLDRKWSERTKKSRWEQDILECGYKFHMNNLNAIIGLEQMKHVDKIIKRHQDNSDFFDTNINNKKIQTLTRSENSRSSSWIYTLLTEQREQFKRYMLEANISADVVHVRNDRYSVFDKFRNDQLKGCDEFSRKMINIPVGWWVTDKEREYIVDKINKF